MSMMVILMDCSAWNRQNWMSRGREMITYQNCLLIAYLSMYGLKDVKVPV